MNYPQYVSHKVVGAAKVSQVDLGADGSVTVGLEGSFDNVVLSQQERRHKPHPEVGNYLVQYLNGYISFSPADVFEEGYTLIEHTHADEIADAASGHGQAFPNVALKVGDKCRFADESDDPAAQVYTVKNVKVNEQISPEPVIELEELPGEFAFHVLVPAQPVQAAELPE